MKKRFNFLLTVLLALLLSACTGAAQETVRDLLPEDWAELLPEDAADVEDAEEAEEETAVPDEDGFYTTRDDVAAYLHAYGHLPGNFITKAEARKKGWEGGSLEPYAPGKSIGGDRFGNYEGLLPDGHTYKECDIDTMGAESRGAKRIVYSADGLIYYTGDHYASFELLYGEAAE